MLSSRHLSYQYRFKGSVFGGPLLGKGNARSKRPMGSRSSFSISLFANEKYSQSNSFLHALNKRRIHVLIRRQCRLCKMKLQTIKVLRSEIHIELQLKDRREYQRFIRSLTGLLSRKLLGKERGQKSPLPKKSNTSTGFWRCRPLTFAFKNTNWTQALFECQKQIAQQTEQTLLLLNLSEEWTVRLKSTA